MYVSTREWRDLEDGHLYQAGDPFPHNGREISAERIAVLTSTQNKAGFAVIKAVAVQNEEKPIETPKAPEKPKKPRKKGA